MEGPGRVTSGAAAGGGGGAGGEGSGGEGRGPAPPAAGVSSERGRHGRPLPAESSVVGLDHGPGCPALRGSRASRGLARVASPGGGTGPLTSALRRRRTLLAPLEIMASARSTLRERLLAPAGRPGRRPKPGLRSLAGSPHSRESEGGKAS